MDVAIVGGSGYGGGELLRLLAAHPVLKVRTVAARSSAGRTVGEAFPNLRGTTVAGQVLVSADVDRLTECDLVFLATPHDASAELAPALVQQGVRVVDLSAAFRLDAPTFSETYGQPHPAPGLAPAVYGLPELYRDEIAAASLVASPGCYPTAALLALAPLAGLVDPAGVVVTGLSGTSGAGRGLREDLHASHTLGNVAPYGLPRHRHAAEIERVWAHRTGLPDAVPVSFTPHLVPMSRGLVCTVVARLVSGAAPGAVAPAFADAYGHEPLVSVLDVGAWPATAHVAGGNGAHVAAAVDERAGAVVASCAIDNLGKGAAGQALQAANLMLELEETVGLPVAGVYP